MMDWLRVHNYVYFINIVTREGSENENNARIHIHVFHISYPCAISRDTMSMICMP